MSKIEDLSDTIKRLHKELSQKNKSQLKDEVYAINSYDLYLILDASIYLYEKEADLEAKLAESEKENKLIIQEDGECLLCGDGYCINNDVAKIVEENKKLKKQLESLDYEKSIKHYSLNRDLANPESEEMQKHLNRYVFKDKFRICCSMCGKTHEYEFKDIKDSDLFNDIYISCKSCPRSLNKLNFPEQAIAFYRTRYDLVCYEKHQDYLTHRNHISAVEEEINQLKQQLVEKENIIVEQKIKIRALNEENFLLKDDIQMAIKIQNKHDIDQNQTAIAELEKAKQKINAYKKQHCLLFVEWDVIEKAVEFIDQQMAQLKGEK